LYGSVMSDEAASSSTDCLACRLSSGGVLSLASLYVAYHGLRRTRPVERSLILATAGVFAGLGIARLFDLPPFGQKRHQ